MSWTCPVFVITFYFFLLSLIRTVWVNVGLGLSTGAWGAHQQVHNWRQCLPFHQHPSVAIRDEQDPIRPSLNHDCLLVVGHHSYLLSSILCAMAPALSILALCHDSNIVIFIRNGSIEHCKEHKRPYLLVLSDHFWEHFTMATYILELIDVIAQQATE